MKVLTGIQPSGNITLGNYIGSILPCLYLQDLTEKQNLIMIADLHALTVEQDPTQLHENIIDLFKWLVASGLDIKKNVFFVQSQVPYHTQLNWLFECFTKFGQLSRMTQFKDKTAKKESFSAGLLTYPTLMAADILLYDIDIVPVGIDQKQHLELARDIATEFNKKYGNTFTVPEPMINKRSYKIMDLQNPNIKMSKSSTNPKGVIYLKDDAKTAYQKIMKAVTDSEDKVYYDPVNKPGISNLMVIYSALTGKTLEEIEEEHKTDTTYKNFKEKVATSVMELLTIIQSSYNLIDTKQATEILLLGSIEAQFQASVKWDQVKEKVGLSLV